MRGMQREREREGCRGREREGGAGRGRERRISVNYSIK